MGSEMCIRDREWGVVKIQIKIIDSRIFIIFSPYYFMQSVFEKLKVAYGKIVVKTTPRPAEKGQGIGLSSCDNRMTVLRSIQI